jgi:oligoribonuclease NrnB/cAMP/cGMP phosphodiesterase (DHH superfamily)
VGTINQVMAQITPEEIQQIKDLQSKYNQTIFEIGAAEAQLIVFQENIEKLDAAKKGLVSDLKTIEQKETELTKTLQEKYGEGNINIETGEITPVQ